MNITYNDFGKLVIERNNQQTCTTTLNNFAYTLFQGLANAVYIDPNASIIPRVYNGISVNFYPPTDGLEQEVVVNYTPDSGAYPTGIITLRFSSPDPTPGQVFYTDFKFSFNVDFFDETHITVTADGVPSVTARFDVQNLDQSRFNLFLYSILGTAFPVWLDKVSNFNYNGVQAN